MKKLVLLLLVFMMVLVRASFISESAVEADTEEFVAQTMAAAPSINKVMARANQHKTVIDVKNPAPTIVPDVKDEEQVDQAMFLDDIPLSLDEQKWLYAACEEFEVPYALALGLIEKETNFRNIIGDDGASTGYMQVQERWHRARMERLGVTDLLEPNGNFRVGLDFLSELYGKYEDWSMALTVYNMGHDPGHITDYAKTVMGNYARWQQLVETHD